MRSRYLFAGLLFVTAVVASCDDTGPVVTASSAPEARVTTRSDALLGGQESDASQDHTVFISVRDNGLGTGSGVMVAPNLVLVATHTVARTNNPIPNSFPCSPGKGTIEVYSVLDPSQVSVLPGMSRPPPTSKGPVAVKKITPMPVADLCHGDISMLLLESDLPGAVITPIRLDTMPAVSESLFGVGWGILDTQNTLPKKRQQRPGLEVLALGPGPYKAPNGLTTYELYDAHFVVTSAACTGDSGSGVFDTTTKALIGTLSAGQNDDPTQLATPEEPTKPCLGAAVFYLRLSYFKDAILAGFKEAGHAPWLEGKPRPAAFGEACTEAAGCDSLQCVRGMCSRGCADSTCPDGYTCLSDTVEAGPQCVQTESQTSGSGRQGVACQKADDCYSGLCLQLDEGPVCSSQCSTQPCLDGWRCDDINGSKACLPPVKASESSSGCSLSAPGADATSGAALLGLAAAMVGRRRRPRR